MSKFIPVGDTFEFNGMVFKVVEGKGMNCTGCAFLETCSFPEIPPCTPESRDEGKEVIYVQVAYKEPKDLVTTGDLQALQLTYEQLARIYALSARCNDYGALYNALKKLLDPEGKVWDKMKGLDSAWDTKYLYFKDHFLSLLFPEATKKNEARIQELEEQKRKIQEEINSLK